MSGARLILKRDRDLLGMLRKYHVLIDRHEAARIADGQELAVLVTPSRHVVRVSLGRTRSNDLELDLDPGAKACLGCRRAGTWLTQFFFGRLWPRPNILLFRDPSGSELEPAGVHD